MNRDPEGASLIPAQNTTELVPTTDFDAVPIWKHGWSRRRPISPSGWRLFTAPIHEALAAEIARIRAAHSVAVLIDCHSIRSKIPFLFEGTLPDLNIGTNNGATCAPAIEGRLMEVVRASSYTNVLNGRFKGGWTTRHYGRPDENVHAVQIEIAQSNYLQTESVPFDYAPEKAERLREILSAIVEELEMLAFGLTGRG